MKYTYPLILFMSILVVPVASVCADDVAQKLDGPEVHSLHELLAVTAQREKEIRKTVHGYTCLIVKRERINGVLQRPRFIRAKVRAGGLHDGQKQPLSVHLTFRGPAEVAGRQIIYVDGKNDGQMIVKRGGKRFHNVTVKVDPESDLVKTETLMDIKHLGFDGMISEIMSQVRQDIAADPDGTNTQLKIAHSARINDRKCTAIVVTHPNPG